MIDIHTHILFDIDDGSRSLSESLVILKEASVLGITDIVLTPHYIKESIYNINNESKKAKFGTLVEMAEKEGLRLKLYLGNEIYIDDNIKELIDNDEVLTINDSKYLLIELPLFGTINNVREIMFELMLKGYQPIIAHPERNEMFQKNKELFSELHSQGVLFQANIGSMIGEYGKIAKKTVKQMLRKNRIHFLSSDIHHQKELYVRMPKIQKKIERMTKGKYELLTKINPNKVLQNEDI